MKTEYAKALAAVGLALCLFSSAISWMLMKFGSIWAGLDLGNTALKPWIVSTYIIFEVAVIPIAGKLIDHYGERPVILIGASVFTVGAVLCGTVNSLELLVVYRAVEGVGAGFAFATAFTSVGNMYTKEKRNKPHELMTGAFAIGSLFGTVVGFWFIQNFSWRYTFYFVAVVMAVGGILAYAFLPKREIERKKLDIPGMVLLFATMFVAMMYTQCVDNNYEMFSSWSAGILLVIAGLAYCLYRVEKKAENPAFPICMWKVQVKCILIMFIASALAIGLIQYYIKIYLLDFDLDIYHTCGMFIALLLGGATTSIMGCKKVHSTGIQFWVIIGAFLLILAFVSTLIIGNFSANCIRLCMFLVGMGLGCIITELLCAIQGVSSEANMGSITSTTMSIRLLGISAGCAIYSHVIWHFVIEGINAYTYKGNINHIIDAIIEAFFEIADTALTSFTNGVMFCCGVAAVAMLSLIVLAIWIDDDEIDAEISMSRGQGPDYKRKK